MTAESALLGKPTISISPIKFYVDDYLVKTVSFINWKFIQIVKYYVAFNLIVHLELGRKIELNIF